MLSWNQLIVGRDQIHKRYPQIWDLKLIKRPSWLVKRHLRTDMRLLDAGKVVIRKKGRKPIFTINTSSFDGENFFSSICNYEKLWYHFVGG